MPIRFRCESAPCGMMLEVPDGTVGKKAQCPRCKQIQIIPPPAPVVGVVAAPPVAPAPQPLPVATAAEDDILDVLPGDDRVGALPLPVTPREEELRFRRRPGPDDLGRERRVPKRLLCPSCEQEVFGEEETCPNCEYPLDAFSLAHESTRLEKQRFLNQLLSFVLGLPGLALWIGGRFLRGPGLNAIVPLVGLVLLGFGIGFAIVYKKYDPLGILACIFGVVTVFVVLFAARIDLGWVGLLPGPLFLVGLIVLACLKDDKRRRLNRIDRLLKVKRAAAEGFSQ